MTAASGSESLESVIRDAEAMLLDFDGVIADSEPFFRRSWNGALEPWGHSIPERDYWKFWSSLGQGLEGEIERRGLSSIDPELARRRQREIYLGFVERGMIPLFPGSVELLEALDSGAGWAGRPYCIASNTPAPLVRDILSAGGAPVPNIVGGEGLEKKPSPAIFLEAASRLGRSPRSTVVLEDSWKGIAAAEKGGFISVLVKNRYNRDLEIESMFRVDGTGTLMEFFT
ncbi:MAG: HAD family phosphatase [Candidatus Aegiribacteria sp.]